MQTSNPYLYHHQLYATNAIDLGPSTSASSSTLTSVAAPFPDNGPGAYKKRKVDRACDACRRRKTKCDGPKMPDNVCTNCLQTRKPCTYIEASKPRGPPKAYVTGLEDRVEQLEAILKQLQPGVDFSDELGPPITRGSWKDEDYSNKSHASSSTTSLHKKTSSSSVSLHPPKSSSTESRLSNTRGRSSPPPLVDANFVGLSSHLPFSSSTSQNPLTKRDLNLYTIPPGDSDQDSFGSDDDSSDTDALVESYGGEPQRLTLRGAAVSVVDGEDNHRRFHGKSSAASLVDATRKFKQMHLLSMEGEGKSTGITPPPPTSTRRAEFWCSPKWELVWEGLHVDSPELIPQVLSKFPADDLAISLIDLHFIHTNTQFPLLHRATFERQWNQKLHHRDIWFACLCLSLFAVAGRWSDDTRVLTPPIVKSETEEIDWSSAGWRYFTAAVDIHRYRRSLLYPATLFEIQTFTLLSMFLRGSTSPAAGWVFVSIGLRKAQDAGAHRKNVYRDIPTIDEELWKRAIWCLIMSDRIGGVSLGRGCGINEEDFDLDLPLDVDDEYMETTDPALAFKQPPGVPSKLSAFILLIKLMQILAFTMKTIYVVNKSRVFSGVFSLDWRDEIVAQINKAMNDWAESIPEHLRWTEDMPDPLFSNQAATLYTTYYLTQMVIFRPFVPSPTRSIESKFIQGPTIPPFPLPAMKICISAAQSCARIIDHQLKRGFSNIPAMCMVSHTGGGMLSWAIWDLKVQERLSRFPGVSVTEDIKPPDMDKVQEYIASINVFIKAMEWSQPRWQMVTPLL
ncbi:hypothetical protein BDN72DRAFT_810971 [Pluteus cervinus]|uniref:Uncharacterized protein n=1 Tax=Pluteus cervinus TaxID=181527 RepID=A0ACD3BCN8_9AGAR|nr:hypothetical protein BDN72DRAFT_810971 [Pluteus cervinus]